MMPDLICDGNGQGKGGREILKENYDGLSKTDHPIRLYPVTNKKRGTK